MPDNRTEHEFLRDMYYLANDPRLQVHTRRSTLYKTIEDYSQWISKNRDHLYISEQALQQCGHLTALPQHLHLEHTVPIGLFKEYFAEEPIDPVVPFVPRAHHETFAALDLVTVCWVTQLEREALRAQGLEAQMPNHITFDQLLADAPAGLLCFARYQACNPQIVHARVEPPSAFLYAGFCQDFLGTQGGLDWLAGEVGQQWLNTRRATIWFNKEVVDSERDARFAWFNDGAAWLALDVGRRRLATRAGLAWLETEAGQAWHAANAGMP